MRKIANAQNNPHSFRGALMLSLDYDTNIANVAGKDIFFGGWSGYEDKRKSAGLAQLVLFNHGYDLGERGGWKWESKLLGYNKDVWKHHDRNLLVATLGTGPTYTADRYKVSFFATYDKINLGSEKYHNAGGANLNMKYIFSPTLIGEADISKKRVIYAGNRLTDFDAMLYAVGARKSFDNENWLLSAYLTYKDEKGRNPLVSYLASKDEIGAKIELSKELFLKGLRGSVAYAYKDINYKDPHILMGKKQEDKEHYYNIGINYAIDKYSYLSLGYSYTDHTSNFSLGEYTKRVTSLTYIRNF